jgi:mycothiol synthase
MQTPRLIDPTTMTDAELGAIYALRRSGRLGTAPDEVLSSVAEMISQARRRPKAYEVSEWVIEGGYAQLHRLGGNPDCNVELVVAPEARRRGLGTRFARFLIEQARAAGCTMLVGAFPDEGGAAFATSLGARIGNTKLVSSMPLPPAAGLEPVPVPGYSIRSWVGEPPEELLESWVRAVNAFNDAPRAAGLGGWVMTTEYVRDMVARMADRGIQFFVTVALDGQGEVAGSTEVQVGVDPGSNAQTRITAVLAEHRRRGLASWLKAESLAALTAARPDVVLVRTSNDATNTGMLAVNHAVGFKTVASYTSAVLDL